MGVRGSRLEAEARCGSAAELRMPAGVRWAGAAVRQIAGARAVAAQRRSRGDLLKPPAPFCTNVELTSMCNQKCVMCPLTAGNTLSGRNRGHMDPGIWAKVLPALRTIGQVQWIGYGETLLHPRALEYTGEADRHGVWSSLATNGTMLTERTCAALGRLQHLVHVTVSVDSLDPQVYRSIRKTPLAPVLEGLQRLVQHVDKRKVTVGSVIMADNVESLDGLPRHIASLGLTKYQINVLHEHKGKHFGGELGTDAQAALARLRAAFTASAVQLVVDVPGRLDFNVNDAAGYRTTYAGVPQDGLTRRCLLPWEFPFIDKDGNVFLCSNATGRDSEVLGSLRDAAFMDIWHNERFQDVRRCFLAAEGLPEACRDCTIQPLGTHPLREYRADILSLPAPLELGMEQDAVLMVRNAGRTAWRAGEVAVGTVRPRDRTSPLQTEGWLSVNRVAANSQPVEPGATAVFTLRLAGKPIDAARATPGQEYGEAFQLVVDGKHWIAGSEFTIAHRPPRPYQPAGLGWLLARWQGPQAAR